MARVALIVWCALACVLLVVVPARAQDGDIALARAEFLRGTELVQRAQWAEALAAFEQSNKQHPHALTTYNIAACQRAMGQYTRAHETFGRALAQNDLAQGAELPASFAADTKGYITELRGLLTNITITLDPPTAGVTFDGRPLEVADANATPPVLLANVLAPGAGERPPAATFTVLADPGAHIITFTRKGYSDAVIHKTYAPGAKAALAVKLDTLPATLHIASEPAGAVVTVADADVGLTPVDVLRPAGSYHVVVKKGGFIPFDSQVTAHAGEELNISPSLPIEKRSIASRWWFWTGIGVVVAGAVLGTALGVWAAQTPARPPVDGGGLNWAVPVN